MDGSRSERARARARHLLAQIAPLPDDTEVQRLRELSVNYIREAERLEREHVTTGEPSEQISAALDAIVRDFFARALQNEFERVIVYVPVLRRYLTLKTLEGSGANRQLPSLAPTSQRRFAEVPHCARSAHSAEVSI